MADRWVAEAACGAPRRASSCYGYADRRSSSLDPTEVTYFNDGCLGVHEAGRSLVEEKGPCQRSVLPRWFAMGQEGPPTRVAVWHSGPVGRKHPRGAVDPTRLGLHLCARRHGVARLQIGLELHSER